MSPAFTMTPPIPNPSLVATLGPASFDLAADIAAAGADAFRFNGSHMTPEALGHAIQKTHHTAADVPLVVDLQGAKMRLGRFDPLAIDPGQPLVLALPDRDVTAVPLPHPEIFHAVRPGDTLGCDDDRVRLRIEACEETRLHVVSLSAGVLRPRKGVNVLEHPVHLQDLTDVDAAQIAVAAAHDAVSFACSFMRDGREVDWIRARCPGARVVGKVERREAIDAMGAVAGRVDEMWICRGDLGAQLGLPDLAFWLAGFDAGRWPVPVLIAGQVLEHLTRHPTPTRSEVCHLHDLLQRGYAGVVLSDETAIGNDPVEATRTARELLQALANR